MHVAVCNTLSAILAHRSEWKNCWITSSSSSLKKALSSRSGAKLRGATSEGPWWFDLAHNLVRLRRQFVTLDRQHGRIQQATQHSGVEWHTRDTTLAQRMPTCKTAVECVQVETKVRPILMAGRSWQKKEACNCPLLTPCRYEILALSRHLI